MAPSKSSRAHDDTKPDSATKEKNGGHTATKMRRGASQTSAAQHREPPAAVTSAPAQVLTDTAGPALNWSIFERRALHAYRREHELNAPSSFSSAFHQWVLSHSAGIGAYSPTMIRKKQARRQGKEQLAMAVRKHFNGMGIQENDVIVDFIYKIRSEKVLKPDGPNKQPTSILD